MKSPVNIPTNHHFLHQRSPSCNGSTAENNTFNQPAVSSTSCYEPTSVLDLRRSSSPVAAVPDSFNPVPAFSGVSSEEPSFQWDGHVLPLSSDDWDSMMWALEEKDNSAPLSKSLPQFGPHGPQSPNFSHLTAPDSFFGSSPHSVPAFNHPSAASWNHSPTYFNLSNNFHQIGSNGGEGIEFDCSQLDQLFQAAGCLESNESQSALTILARLNQRLQFPMGKPLQRAAFYFKEALLSLLTGSNRIDCSLSSSEIVYKIRAYKALWEISPVVQFANFTANQALFEAVDGAMFIHIIDFEIGLGGQWASFMQEIASNSRSRNVPPSSLRITAVVPEESFPEANLIKDNLCQFARELGIRFEIDFVIIRVFEVILFDSIKCLNGEMTAINLSPTIFRYLNTSSSIPEFLRVLSRMSPQIIVFVDADGCRDTATPSFRRNFIGALEFYTSVLESLDAGNTRGMDVVRKIEKYLLRPKMLAAVDAARYRMAPWEELFALSALRPVRLSEFTETQADCLVRRWQVRGFRVAKRESTMLLCWQGRELLATSAWRSGR